MNKNNILSRILKLEETFPTTNYDIKEHIQNLIIELENFLGYSISERFILPEFNNNVEELEKIIFKSLTVDELRKIAYK